ncbi:MAG: phosphate signaling complex protein PhoU [Sinobacteraceae bacterium]|nr:phosphate signaling complex protein PhoU [Nevskiaceae bacterium]
MLEGHISKAFDGALATLHIRVVEMGGLVLDQVREAAVAYTEWQLEPAERVLEREHQVNEYNTLLNEEQLTLIARRQPVAGDLKAILAMSKVVAELERAGDEAKKIARTVIAQGGRPGPATARDVRHLGQLAVSLLRASLESFDRLDAAAALEVIARDRDLDSEYEAGLRRLMTRAMEDPRQVSVALEAAFALKSLERIGDHARNVARYLRSFVEDPNAVPQSTTASNGPP